MTNEEEQQQPSLAQRAGAAAGDWAKDKVNEKAREKVGQFIAQKTAQKATGAVAKKAAGAVAKKAAGAVAQKAAVSAAAGAATGGTSLAVQAGYEALKKIGQASRGLLQKLNLHSPELDGLLRKTFGKAGEAISNFFHGLLALSIIPAILTLVVILVFVCVAFPWMIAVADVGSANYVEMAKEASGGLTPDEIDAVERGLPAPDVDLLAARIQRDLNACNIFAVRSYNLEEVDNCLSNDRDIPRRAIDIIRASAGTFQYLQCVGFKMAAEPAFPGVAYPALLTPSNLPSGWRAVSSGEAEPGDNAVWGPSSRCPAGGSCDSYISCCGHIGVITGVDEVNNMFYITQAWGDTGAVNTMKVHRNNPSLIIRH